MADRSEIDEVRSRTDIVTTIEQYVTLKRAGRNLKGLCPFHNEKTHSFQVNPDIGVWKCFGCDEGGDVIKFVQKIENLSFIEALERLAMRAGITLTRGSFGGAPRNQYTELSERDRIYKVNGLAQRFYRETLALSEVARNYLADRGITSDTQNEFCLGYAPEAWDGLTSFLIEQDASIADAELAGLVSRNDRGGYYDRLRGRLIFPIFDVQDRPIAFGGRLIAPAVAGQPKYWNSPEHPAFSKSRTLYGLGKARKAIADERYAIVVEGYTDVTSAYQAGFKNVVAPLGTALTEDHVRTLARLAPSVLLCFDADSAGLKAAFRAAEIFAANEMEVKVLDLPEGEDPDSLLRAGRREEFASAIVNAVPLIEYRVQRLIRREQVSTDRDRIALMHKAMPILASVKSVIEREQYIKMLVSYHPGLRHGTAAAEEQIRRDVETYIAGHSDSRSPYRGEAAPPEAPRKGSPVREAADQAERQLIRALLSGNDALAGRVLAGVRPEEFVTARGQALASSIFGYLLENPQAEAAAVIGSVQDETLAQTLTDIVMGSDEPLTAPQLDGVIAYLKTRSTTLELSHLKELINRGEATSEQVARHASLFVELKGSKQAAVH